MVNYASARLALGTSSPDQRTVSQASLAHYPRGPLIGIPGLPEPRPALDRAGRPAAVGLGGAASDQATRHARPRTTLAAAFGRGPAIAVARARLVSSAGWDWGLWDGQRLMISRAVQQNVLTALAAAGPPAGVPATWPTPSPRVPSSRRPGSPGSAAGCPAPGAGPPASGRSSPRPRGSGPPQDDVLRRDGLEPVTRTEAALLNAARGQVPQGAVAPSVVAGDRAGASMPAAGLPSACRHSPATTRRPRCARYSDLARPAGLGAGCGWAGPRRGRPAGRRGRESHPDRPAARQSHPGRGGSRSGRERERGGGDGILPHRRGAPVRARVPGVAAMLGYQLDAQRTLVPASVPRPHPPRSRAGSRRGPAAGEQLRRIRRIPVPRPGQSAGVTAARICWCHSCADLVDTASLQPLE